MTPQEQLQFLRDKRDMCFDNMEGADGPEFERWQKLFCAYQCIVEDMEHEQKTVRRVD